MSPPRFADGRARFKLPGAASVEGATIVRFFADDPASAFHDAAAYLFDHPDFEVQAVAVNYDDANLAHCLALTVLADRPDF